MAQKSMSLVPEKSAFVVSETKADSPLSTPPATVGGQRATVREGNLRGSSLTATGVEFGATKP